MNKKLNSKKIEDCLFCKIVKKEIPANIVYENENTIAFLDINPISDGHTLVISKSHCKNLSEASEKDVQDVAATIKVVANKILNSKLKPWGINYLSNQNEIAGQIIDHFHFHIIPKYAKNEGLVILENKNNEKNVDEIYKLLVK